MYDCWDPCSACIQIFDLKIKAQDSIQRKPVVGASFNANVWQFESILFTYVSTVIHILKRATD